MCLKFSISTESRIKFSVDLVAFSEIDMTLHSVVCWPSKRIQRASYHIDWKNVILVLLKISIFAGSRIKFVVDLVALSGIDMTLHSVVSWSSKRKQRASYHIDWKNVIMVLLKFSIFTGSRIKFAVDLATLSGIDMTLHSVVSWSSKRKQRASYHTEYIMALAATSAVGVTQGTRCTKWLAASLSTRRYLGSSLDSSSLQKSQCKMWLGMLVVRVGAPVSEESTGNMDVNTCQVWFQEFGVCHRYLHIGNDFCP